jgi:hypothetical protein
VGLDLKFEAWPSTEGGGRVGSGVAWNKKKEEKKKKKKQVCLIAIFSSHRSTVCIKLRE